MTIRELVAKFGLDFDRSSFQRADTAVSKLKKGAVALAGVLVANKAVRGLQRIVEETAAAGDSIDKTSKKLGVQAQALQELRYAGELTGVATRTLDMALQRFTRRTAEAAKGTGEAKGVLEEMGIQLTDTEGRLRPSEALLGDVADRMKGMSSDGERLRVAFKLFDSEGAALVNTLKDGRGALEGMRAEARALGGVMDKDLIAASVELTDNKRRLKEAIQGVKNVIAKALLPSMNKAIEGALAWLRANRELIATRLEQWLRTAVRVMDIFGHALGGVAGVISDMVELLPQWAKGLSLVLGVGLALAAVFGAPALLVMALIYFVGILIKDLQSAEGFFYTIFEGFMEEVERLGKWEAFKNLFTEAIDYWKPALAGFWEWVQETFGSNANELANTLAGVVGGGDKNRAVAGSYDPMTGEPVEPGKRIIRKEQLFSPLTGETFRGGRRADRYDPVTGEKVSITQTIFAAPGMDEKAVGDAAAAGVKKVLEGEARHAQRALVPARQG